MEREFVVTMFFGKFGYLARLSVPFSGNFVAHDMFPIHSSLEIPEDANRNFSSKCRKRPISVLVTGHSILFRKKVRGLRDDSTFYVL